MKVTWAYIAGIYDGEGSLYYPLQRPEHNKRIEIGQSGEIGKALLNFIKEKMGYGVVRKQPHNFYSNHTYTLKSGEVKNFGKPQDVYQLGIFKRREIRNFLEKVLPYLIVKKKKAEEVLNYLKKNGFKGAQWEVEEDKLIQKNYRTKSFRDIAEILERTHKSVRNHAYKIGVHKGRGGIHSESFHKRLIEARHKRKDLPMLGKHHSQETIKKIKESNRLTFLKKHGIEDVFSK